jgi:hypothetical protein
MAGGDATVLVLYPQAGRIGYRGTASMQDATSVAYLIGRVGYRGTAGGLFDATALAYGVSRTGYRGTCSFIATSSSSVPCIGRTGFRGHAGVVPVIIVIPEATTVPPRIYRMEAQLGLGGAEEGEITLGGALQGQLVLGGDNA